MTLPVPAAVAPADTAAGGLEPALLPASPAGYVLVPAEAIGGLAGEIARLNRHFEDILARERSGWRLGDDRKETWILLGALTLVVMFCLVAFCMNQAQMRELESGLQDEIGRAGHSTAASVERAIAGFRLERLPEAQAGLERFLREREERDGQRFSDLLVEIERQSALGGSHLREELRAIGSQLDGLRQLAEEIHVLRNDLGGPPVGPRRDDDAAAGRTARAPDGAVREPPVPAARPSGPDPGPQLAGGRENPAAGGASP